MIDLRSDTVTRPNQAMLNAMFAAKVGDDVFGEDSEVNYLQKFASELFNFEDALFCPSGTMTNQIALFLQSGPMQEILLHPDSHVYQYEGGGISFHARASVKFLAGEQGKISANHLAASINPNDVHRPKTSLVSIENTTNRGGGACYTEEELQHISSECRRLNLKLHLDGARLANALVAKKIDTNVIGKLFDSTSVCLSKGLGAPVGSLLLGSKDLIKEAKRVRKVFGGGMRQAGFLAAAGTYAIKNNWQRLQVDHEHAQEISHALRTRSWVASLMPVETNIIIFEVNNNVDDILNHLKSKSILALPFGPKKIRFVTHLDISKQDVEKILDGIETY